MDAARARESLDSRRSALAARELSPQVEEELKEIDAALHRLSTGSWGHCEKCGGAIGRNLLRAMPESRHCSHCLDGVER
ncbi:MAG: TraR/DksA C4-type zinc finger protein [Myxococcaceae bacterium]|nr:TraR/DksA C4-type zinc finger protein [Myxococcaceae bacterium]